MTTPDETEPVTTAPQLSEEGQPLGAGAQSADELLLEFCEACGDFIAYWGFKSIHGRVWAYLALYGGPLAQRQIAEALGVSRASVNLAIAELASYGLVSPTSELHHAPYVANLDVWPVIVDVLERREWPMIDRAKRALEALLAHAERRGESSALNFQIERVKQLLQMTEWAQGILRVLINARLPQTQDSWLLWFGKAMKLSDRIKSLLS